LVLKKTAAISGKHNRKNIQLILLVQKPQIFYVSLFGLIRREPNSKLSFIETLFGEITKNFREIRNRMQSGKSRNLLNDQQLTRM